MARNAGVEANAIWERLSSALCGRYTFIDWLGSGAFGDVLRARQLSTGQYVAIKVLRTKEDRVSRARFTREMRACAALDHPNIVRVIDAGVDDESAEAPLYTVFEYVPGVTLAQKLLDEGALPVATSLNLMSQVLDGLGAAHAAGVVHRDLKPANIMVTDSAGALRAKVLDFGIAALVDESNGQTRLTMTGERLGTPAYCAPEQLQGELASPCADYYAWGLVFLETLTGRHAWQSTNLPELLRAQFSHEAVPLPPLLAAHRLGELLRWTLEKNPARRAKDSRFLLAQLGRLEVSDLSDLSGLLPNDAGFARNVQLIPATEAAPLSPARGERRSAVSLCCRIDVATLTTDEEESLDELLADVREMVANIAQQHGGALMGCAGAEMLLCFGLSSRDGGSISRAARAALLIREQCVRRASLMNARAGWSMDFRLGLHHGIVTLNASGGSSHVGLSSSSVIASRLCDAARHGEIGLSESAYARLHALFDIENKTAANGLGWYSLLAQRPSSAPSAGWGQAQAVGRQNELQRLRAAWEAPASARLRRVLVTGPAGIGKTHLANAWQRELSGQGVRILASRCVPEGMGTAMQPILELLGTHLQFDRGDTKRGIQALARLLHERDIPDHNRALSLLCSWYGFATDQPIQSDVSPKKRRDASIDLMAELMRGFGSTPTVLLFEDIQWADPTTLDLLGRLARMAPGASELLLLCTMRTGTVPFSGGDEERPTGVAQPISDAIGGDDAVTINLEALPRESARQLLLEVWTEPTPSEDALGPIIERAAGIPLFLLELARCRAVVSELPASIAELLSVRIDQLGNARETAQLAAVIAPEFEYDVLAELSLRRADLLGDLQHLQDAGLLFSPREGSYAFSHSLLRDSAYQSLPRKDRRRLHAAVAAVLKRRNPELESQRPWVLALHQHGAGHLPEALRLGVTAATLALMRFDNLEALSYVRHLKGEAHDGFRRGWMSDLEDVGLRAEVELQILSVETTALMLTRGWADQELNQVCSRAGELFTSAPIASTVQLRYALAQFYFNRGFTMAENTGRELARRYIGELIETARICEASALQRLGCMMLGAWHLFSGELEESLLVLNEAQREGDPQDAWKFGFDAHIGARSVESLTRWFKGVPDVLEFSDETVHMAAALKHQASHAIALLYRASLLQLSQDRTATANVCTELLAFCDRYGLQGYPGYAMILLGWANNDPDLAERAHRELTLAGQGLTRSYYGSMIAHAELECGRYSTAWDRLLLLRSEAERSGELFCLPEILLLTSHCARQLERDDQLADDYLTRALEFALQQQAFGACRSIITRGVTEATNAATLERLDRALSAVPTDQASVLRQQLRRARPSVG